MTGNRRILLGDVGGTNLRLAVYDGKNCGPITTLSRAAYADIDEAITAHLHDSTAPALDAIALAVAGPVQNGRIVMTNADWQLDTAALQQRFGLSAVWLVNDFVATAWALPHFSSDALRQFGGGTPEHAAPKAACGPGTGLGVSAFLPAVDGGYAMASEAGHMTLAGQDAGEDAVLAVLRQRFGHASAERALSGPGLENLHQAMATVEKQPAASRPAAEILAAAQDGSCDLCRRTVGMFCALLGSFAGDLALAFDARGGLYLAGGIVPRMLDLLDKSTFRARFEAKGRFRSQLERIPVFAVLHPESAILGLQAMVDRNAV
ncbi:glucokinase [Ferrovibrio sp.]|uniref:glucokinase n=1 Tax=Ferrovibrio sp. TaxID=1917215 RepID=UPI002611ED12|nr:glucokinase [Ferrovibrio sp.]